MRYRKLAGKDASVIALGSVPFGATMSEAQSFEFMDAFRDMGGTFIDTARVYGDFVRDIPGLAEETIGRWMAARHNREDLVIGTKGGHPRLQSMHTGRLDRESLLSDMADSLEALQTDYVDVYWLHRDDLSRPVGDILESLNLFVQRGQARLLGASNWTWQRIAEANEYAAAHGMAGFAANQPQFSLARQMLVEDDTLVQMDGPTHAFHERAGLPCVCFSSQAKGFFIKLHDQGLETMPDKALRRFNSPENMAVYERLCALSLETGHSVGALQLAYLTCQSFDTYPIAGASRVEQVQALREAGDLVLTPDQVRFLRDFADE